MKDDINSVKTKHVPVSDSIMPENPLGYAPMAPLIAKYAIPSVISMLVMSLYNITDQIFIGNVIGMLGNAATNVAFPTVTLATGLSMLFGIGTAANFSINQGAKRMDEAKAYIMSGMGGIILVAVLTGILVYVFRSPIIILCGGQGNVYPYALSYLSITCFGLPTHMFTNACANIIRADGSPRYSMAASMSGVLLNIFLDWLFMYPLDMGIQGAALATIAGQILSFTVTALYFRHFKAFEFHFSEIRLKGSYLFSSMKTGIPNFCNHMLMMTTNIVLNNMLTMYGAMSIYGADIPLAVSGIAAKLNTIMVGFAVGTAQGCQPIWGFNLGAKNYKRVQGAYWRAFAFAIFIGLIFFTCLQCFPQSIISLFGKEEDPLYYEFAVRYLKTYMMAVAVCNIQPVSINYFTATGNAGQGIIVSLSRQGVFLIPLLVLLPRVWGIDGILYAGPIADTLAFILSLTMVLISMKRMNAGKLDRKPI